MNRNYQRGEQRHNARLTPDKVRAIRASDAKHAALAAEHGVTTGTIEHVKALRTWRHVG